MKVHQFCTILILSLTQRRFTVTCNDANELDRPIGLELPDVPGLRNEIHGTGTEMQRTRLLRRHDAIRGDDDNQNIRRGISVDTVQQRNFQTLSKLKILKLSVYNFDTKIVDQISNTTVLDLEKLNISSPDRLNLEAVSSNGTGSVHFAYMQSPSNSTTDSAFPFSFCGNYGKVFLPCPTMPYGIVTLTVTPYPLADRKGTPGTPYFVSFSILERSCPLPKFLGSKWEVLKPYPINVAEAAGGFIGMDTKSKRKDDFLVFSGFADSWYNVTTTVYAINVTSAAASWREVDPVPVPIGFSHSGCTINANVLYACGGYVGPNPGKETNVCLQYTHGSRKGTQWKILPSLPRGRAGGALFHVNASNSLVFATGATRSDPTDIWKSIDHSDVWELFLNNTAVGWISRKATPYRANHVSYASIPYQGKQKHFVLGGQKTSDEGSGNVADMIEWDPLNRSWTRRANMLFARGHASSSTIPIPGCGMLIAGGAVNAVPPQRYRQTNDISYYDIATNNWTKVGTLPMYVNTPVCDIARLLNGTTFLYCHTGKVDRPVSFRRQISL